MDESAVSSVSEFGRDPIGREGSRSQSAMSGNPTGALSSLSAVIKTWAGEKSCPTPSGDDTACDGILRAKKEAGDKMFVVNFSS